MNVMRPNKDGFFRMINAPDGKGVAKTLALGNGTQFDVRLFWDEPYLAIGIFEKGCYQFSGFTHWTYVYEKLGIINTVDAQNVADFLNDQWSYRHGVALYPRQGRYKTFLCSEDGDV